MPLSWQQEQVWFLSRLAPNNRAYHLQTVIRLTGGLDRKVLAAALSEIVRRHEILRTTFHQAESGAVQVVHEPWPVEIPETDLRYLPEERRLAEAQSHIARELARDFDCSRLPLIR